MKQQLSSLSFADLLIGQRKVKQTSKHDEVNQSINQIIINSKRNDAITKKIKELEGEYIDFIEVIDKEK